MSSATSGRATGVVTDAGPAGCATIVVNDQPRVLGADCTVAALVAELGLAGRNGVAIAVNDAVVPRSTWVAHVLAADDRVLVIRATQGG
ncbi:sulfur carrier protein ThiS [Opitutus sp. ER46]|uniref:sulfur carrier protein ThiS n=1 Tax=Opitutus sp. ER46 TaxID=2161864 RepID=UPI000D31856C|nr:sulfur carrier protein ThiS [Opitutus sp. ER46]PTX97690.1 thiamine biosynthesis protein ThiS [Opitutus sp. ER46]